MNISSPDTNEDWHFIAFLELLNEQLFWNLINYENKESLFYDSFFDFLNELSTSYHRYLSEEKDTKFLLKEKHALFELLLKKLFRIEKDKVIHLPSKVIIDQNGNAKQKTAELQYRYLIKAIDVLAFSLNKDNPPEVDGDAPNRQKFNGFLIRNTGCIKDVFQQLIKFQLIANNTDYDTFEKAFLGMIPKTKIVWEGKKSELYYFISQIFARDYVRNGEKSKWDIALNTFMIKGEPEYKKANLKSQDTPKDLEKLETILRTFSENE